MIFRIAHRAILMCASAGGAAGIAVRSVALHLCPAIPAGGLLYKTKAPGLSAVADLSGRRSNGRHVVPSCRRLCHFTRKKL